MDDLFDHVAQVCDAGLYATAGQVYAWGPTEAIDGVIGANHLGQEIRPDDLGEVFCLTKPIVAMAAVRAAEIHGLDVFAPLRDVVDLNPQVGPDLSIATIVNHETTLKAPSALDFMLGPVAERPAVRDLTPGATIGPCYSEIAGWLILVAVIEQLTGTSCDDFVRLAITGPLGIADEIVLAPDRLPELARGDRLLPAVGGLPSQSVPLLHLFAPAYWSRVNPALGGLASARAIGTFTSALVDCLAGVEVNGLPSPDLVARIGSGGRRERFDATWQRWCAILLGYEYSTKWSFDGSTTPLVLQSSFVSMAVVVADLERNQGFALLLNGGSTSGDDLGFCRDQVLLTLGYRRDVR